jgi:hypothetical protein
MPNFDLKTLKTHSSKLKIHREAFAKIVGTTHRRTDNVLVIIRIVIISIFPALVKNRITLCW